MILATYFDGHSGEAHSVHLAIKSGILYLIGRDIDMSFALTGLHLEEPFMHAPSLINLGDGTHLEIHGEAEKWSLRRAFNYRASIVVQCQSLWLAAIVAVAVMVGLLISAYFWGVPIVTAALVERMPASAERAIGDEMLPVLDRTLLAPSGLSSERMAQANAVLDSIRPSNPRMPLRLVFRSSPRLGANAVALPNGTIIVTDKMIADITAVTDDLTGEQANQLAGVLAHEIGHVENRHTLKAMLSNSMVAAIASSMFGDFSAIATAAPTIAIGSSYSRDMESEADGYAISLLKQHHISPICLAEVFELMRADRNKTINPAVPKWMQIATDYVSSHPTDDSRIRRFREAANDDVSKPAPESETPTTPTATSAKP